MFPLLLGLLLFTSMEIQATVMRLSLHPEDRLIHLEKIQHDPPEHRPIYTIGVLKTRPENCAYPLTNSILISVNFWSNMVHSTSFPAYKCIRSTEVWNRLAKPNAPIEWNITRTFSRLSTAACTYMAQYKTSAQGTATNKTKRNIFPYHK